MTRIRIEIPATSANLGPGFDSLALALDLVDTVTVQIDSTSQDVVLEKVSGTQVQLDPHDNLLCSSYRRWAQETGIELPGARFQLESRIPIGKGFGTSAACIVAGLTAAAYAADERTPRESILQLAARLDGHADNAVAAVLGGITVAFCDEAGVHALNVANHLTLGVGVFVPDEPLPTVRARAALPDAVPMKDAVFNVSRAAYLVTALIWGRWNEIGPAMEDRLHQQYRTSLIPGMTRAIAAAREAGAYGAALSGGGPAIIALGPKSEAQSFTRAMEAAARDAHWPGHGLVTGIRHTGLTVSREP